MKKPKKTTKTDKITTTVFDSTLSASFQREAEWLVSQKIFASVDDFKQSLADIFSGKVKAESKTK